MRRLFALTALMAVSAAPEAGYHYWLDGPHSAVTAKVSYMGFGSKTVRFPQMRGSIRLNPARLDAIGLDVELDARTLSAGSLRDTNYLRGKAFFAVEKFPVVHFSGHRMVMTGPTTGDVAGQITARGVTRPAKLAVTFRDPPGQASGHDPLQLTASTSINRKDFGMTAYSVVVGKTVTITIDARLMPG